MSYLQDFLKFERARLHWSQGGLSVSVFGGNGTTLFFDESRKDVQELISELTLLTALSFGMPLDEESNDGTRHHIQNVSALAILHTEDEALGFASGIFPREDSFYLHGIAISPKAKGHGAAKKLVGALHELSGLEIMAFTTQNPVMFCLARSVCREIYPNPEKGLPDVFQKQATRLMNGRSQTFEQGSGVCRNLYTRCLYEFLPPCGDESVNEWFDSELDVHEGQTCHGFLFMGQL